jgi:hypothetical protein
MLPNNITEQNMVTIFLGTQRINGGGIGHVNLISSEKKYARKGRTINIRG